MFCRRISWRLSFPFRHVESRFGAPASGIDAPVVRSSRYEGVSRALQFGRLHVNRNVAVIVANVDQGHMLIWIEQGPFARSDISQNEVTKFAYSQFQILDCAFIRCGGMVLYRYFHRPFCARAEAYAPVVDVPIGARRKPLPTGDKLCRHFFECLGGYRIRGNHENPFALNGVRMLSGSQPSGNLLSDY